jgi:hypothetical protein
LDALDRGVDPLAGDKIADRENSAVPGSVAASTEHAQMTAGPAQPRRNEAPQRPCAASEQDE